MQSSKSRRWRSSQPAICERALPFASIVLNQEQRAAVSRLEAQAWELAWEDQQPWAERGEQVAGGRDVGEATEVLFQGRLRPEQRNQRNIWHQGTGSSGPTTIREVQVFNNDGKICSGEKAHNVEGQELQEQFGNIHELVIQGILFRSSLSDSLRWSSSWPWLPDHLIKAVQSGPNSSRNATAMHAWQTCLLPA